MGRAGLSGRPAAGEVGSVSEVPTCAAIWAVLLDEGRQRVIAFDYSCSGRVDHLEALTYQIEVTNAVPKSQPIAELGALSRPLSVPSARPSGAPEKR